MDDDEYFNSLFDDNSKWGYHEICKWLPYKPETIDEIAQNMVASGYRNDRPIILYEGLILDGRHRYEAALKANIDPIFVEFQGTRAEAIDYVTSENVARRHLNNTEKEYFYVQRSEALGVRTRADNQHPTNVGSTPPSAKEHAEALGVSDRTVERWEDTRKEIKADPELSKLANTFEGYKEAKKELKARQIVVPDYDVATAMGAIKGIAEMFGKRYTGSKEDAAEVLFGKLIDGYDQDEIGLSIARDYVKWFLNLKEVLDLAQPELEAFLDEKPQLKLVN